MPLDQRQHRAQIGRFRQSVAPAPFQGLEHGCADPRVQRQIAQAETAGLTALAQFPAGAQQRIGLGFGGGHRRSPFPPQPAAQASWHG